MLLGGGVTILSSQVNGRDMSSVLSIKITLCVLRVGK